MVIRPFGSYFGLVSDCAPFLRLTCAHLPVSLIVSLVVVLLSCTAFSDRAFGAWLTEDQAIMGTNVRVEIWSDDEAKGRETVEQAMAEMRRIDALMSPYIATSELAKINAEASVQPVVVSTELFDLLLESLRHSEQSGGAFDITFASVGYFYDYRRKQKPAESSLKQKAMLINYKLIKLDPQKQSVSFGQSGVRIDLGGIAKGYAVDKAIHLLKAAGVEHGLVRAGGDSRLLGDKKGRPWWLGIKHPRQEGFITSLPLENVAVSTSGDYERFFIDESGHRQHHILDPANGKPAMSVQSVTVIADEAVLTDPLSTTVFVMGVQGGLDYINRMPGVSVIIIDKAGQMFYSDDLIAP